MPLSPPTYRRRSLDKRVSWLLRVAQLYGLSLNTLLSRLGARPAGVARFPHWFSIGGSTVSLDALCAASFAAIHCNKGLCYRLARAANGGYQAIEEIAANRLRQFASEWDRAGDAATRLRSVTSLIDDCFHKRAPAKGEPADPDDEAIRARMLEAARTLGEGDGAVAAAELLTLARKRPRWKLYRGALWRDCERAVSDLASGRVAAMLEATVTMRQRASNSGREPIRNFVCEA